MRYDGRATFVKLSAGGYDPALGREVDGAVLSSTTLPADLNPMGQEVQQAVFGNINPDRWVVRLQRPHKSEYTHVVLNGKKYTAYMSNHHRRNTVYYLEPK